MTKVGQTAADLAVYGWRYSSTDQYVDYNEETYVQLNTGVMSKNTTTYGSPVTGITVQQPGLYLITAQVRFYDNPSGYTPRDRELRIRTGNVTDGWVIRTYVCRAGGIAGTGMTASALAYMEAGDTARASVIQRWVGGNLNLVGGSNNTTLKLVRVPGWLGAEPANRDVNLAASTVYDTGTSFHITPSNSLDTLMCGTWYYRTNEDPLGFCFSGDASLRLPYAGAWFIRGSVCFHGDDSDVSRYGMRRVQIRCYDRGLYFESDANTNRTDGIAGPNFNQIHAEGLFLDAQALDVVHMIAYGYQLGKSYYYIRPEGLGDGTTDLSAFYLGPTS